MAEVLDKSVGLRWTGHPFIDAGVAGLTVFAKKRKPEDVTGAHLEKFAEWAKDAYFTKEMAAWLSVVISLNDVRNPSKSQDEQKKQATEVLLSFRNSTTALDCQCSFFDRVANNVLSRGLFPLLNADGQMNFGAEGQPGLPVSGLIVTVLQAMSLSVPLVGGRAMVIAPDNPQLLLQIVEKWQPIIQSRVQLSADVGEKMPIWGNPKTRLVGELIELSKINQLENSFGGITIYHSTNSGQGPDISIHTLEIPAIQFVRKAQSIMYKAAWDQLERTAFQPAAKDKDQTHATRNDVYERLFDLPRAATRFISKFFTYPTFNRLKTKPMRVQKPKSKKTSSSDTAPEMPKFELVALWGLLELFLEEVLGMEKNRIEAIRTLGDRLADMIHLENDKALFREVYEAKSPNKVRFLLNKLSMKRLQLGLEPATRVDEYITIFEEGEELAPTGFWLAWDLTKMRVIETLFDKQSKIISPEILAEINIEPQGDE